MRLGSFFFDDFTFGGGITSEDAFNSSADWSVDAPEDWCFFCCYLGSRFFQGNAKKIGVKLEEAADLDARTQICIFVILQILQDGKADAGGFRNLLKGNMPFFADLF